MNTQRLSPELLAVLACARTVVDHGNISAFQSALGACRSPEELCKVAVTHGMVGHLHHLVSTTSSAPVDDELMRRLSELQRLLVARNLNYTGVLLRVLSKLDDAGVRALSVKGPAWAELLYGDLSLRTWSDLDLLVEPQQAAEAREVLQQMGFEDCSPLSRQSMRSRWGDTGQIALGSRELRLVVDLHWKLTVSVSPRGLTPDAVFARAGRVTLLGQEVVCPGKSDVFLITCLEGTRDLWSSVARLLDLAVQIERTKAGEWVALLDQAKEAGCERRTLVAVGYACRVFEMGLPPTIEERLGADRRSRALIGRLEPVQLCGAPPVGLQGRLTLLRAHAAGEDNRLDCLRFVMTRLFAPTSEDRQAFSLPRRMEWLYVPLRVLRLAGKWLKRLLSTGDGGSRLP
jgi:hypothetical protein